MAFNFKDKLDQAKQLLAVAPLLAEGLKEQATTKLSALKDSAQEKIETGRAVVAQVQAVAPIVIAIKKEEYKGKLNTLAERFGLASKPAQRAPSPDDFEALLKAMGAEAHAEEAAPEAEHEAPAAEEPAAAAPAANDAAPKAKKSGGKKKKAASTRKPK